MTNEKTTEKKLSNQVLKYSAGESEGRKRTTPKKRKRTRKDGAQPEKKGKERRIRQPKNSPNDDEQRKPSNNLRDSE